MNLRKLFIWSLTWFEEIFQYFKFLEIQIFPWNFQQISTNLQDLQISRHFVSRQILQNQNKQCDKRIKNNSQIDWNGTLYGA